MELYHQKRNRLKKMASPVLQSVSTPALSIAVDNTTSTTSEMKIYSGGGGGPTVDAETKNYLDAKVDSVKAQNDARFAEVLAKLDVVSERIVHLEPLSIWKLASVAAVSVVTLLTIMGIMADRFDGGIAANGLVSAFQKDQAARDAAQDAKLDTAIDLLKQIAIPKE
jgi:hypothetical protein